MKIINICLISIFLYSSCDNSPSDNSKEMTRYDEILKIMREYHISGLEDATWLSVKDRDELRKLKDDYYYEIDPNLDLSLTIPGPSWEIRGLLTPDQFEKEQIELYEKILQLRNKAYGSNEKFEDSELGKECVLFKNTYRKGDEIYYFRSDHQSWAHLRGRSGYVIIRDNKVLNKLVTIIN